MACSDPSTSNNPTEPGGKRMVPPDQTGSDSTGSFAESSEIDLSPRRLESTHPFGDVGAEFAPPKLDPSFNRYEILDEIARGGMGVVLRGRDRLLSRELAIKALLDRNQDD